ncbi:heat shock 70 kDa protein [Tribolium castaneum]|uniref:Heat shock 70 kDa protein cognate 4-like Protein n=1 Tax=Tribolium castaneum TaxID=7070 RepID=D2A3D9_TRICA|nr:PREDICTED: heat shock 70 kDa protein [Tribolium castaneum]XP_975210.1 PREDICTED: heat shock 70 kDa protein [Tribolium castaneum]EFA02300.1 Heat shock 70 kDa protein cognate 4-like Protein [Tribolium castaneum]|eukprot:XP_015834944.1 PREDICTED: heat shock 70 kDa protein [Tribolium castaneum]
MSETVIGIDLGTTNSCVCVHLNNKLKILENKEGGRTTPSYVFFTEHSFIVGQYAKRMADAKPEYGIYEIKRLVGRKYDDPYVKKNLNYLPFKVTNISNEPVVVVQTKNQVLKKSPQELCAYILGKIKSDVEAKLGHPVDKAVITVPAYFNIAQREVTLAAAQTAGFSVLKLLNEPTAAALSYYYENKSNVDGYSLVYDLGGGTFDVAILQRSGSDITIVGVDGETHLGGHDFDNLLVEHVCQVLINQHNYNPKNDRRNMRRLNNECEEVKKILSEAEETNIILNAFVPNQNTVDIPITRAQFEAKAEQLFQKTIEIVTRCLEKVSLEKSDIKEVILSGGSTRIPKIQSLISAYFGGKILNKFINPDECVAEGAAIQAALLSKDPAQAISQIKITDVTPLSLGIADFVDVMTFMIKRNTPIPVTRTTNRVTVYNNQANMSFHIYEGERLDAKKNYFLGRLEITDLTPAPPGQCSVTVVMTVDQNGILTVKATETVSNRTKDLKIVYTRGSRSDSDIKSVVVEAEENKKEDELFKQFAEVKGYVVKYCIRAMYNFENKGLVATHKDAYDKCNDVLNRLKDLDVDDEKEVKKLKVEVLALCQPLQKKYAFKHMP